MKKMEINVPTELKDSKYGEIELTYKGQLLIKSERKSITIEKLINNKTTGKSEQGDIVVMGTNGKRGADGTGEDGENGITAKGKCSISIGDVSGKIYVQSWGGAGGDGGRGTDGDNGGKGGRGGDGSDAPTVAVKFDKADDSDSGVYFFASAGGVGGCGGNGGNSSLGRGIGGVSTLPSGSTENNTSSVYGTKGGVFGDGGDAGTTGKGGVTIIFNPDGSYTINGEYSSQKDKISNKITGSIDFGNPDHVKHWIDMNGGIDALADSPEKLLRLLYAIKKSKNADSANDVYVVTAALIDAAMPITEGVSDGKGDSHFSFIADSNSNCQPKPGLLSTNLSENNITLPQVTGCTYCYLIENLDEKFNVVNSTTVPYDFIDGDEYHRFQLDKTLNKALYWGRYIRLSLNVTYFLDDKDMGSVTTDTHLYDTQSQADNFLKQVKVFNPKYQFGGQRMTDKIVVLYGRTPQQGEPIYSNADYYGTSKDNYYYANNDPNALRTIIPMTGEILLKDVGKYKVKNAELLDFPLTATGYAPSLSYHVDSGAPIPAATYQNARTDLVSVMKDKFKYDRATNKLTFEFTVGAEGYSPYDWNSGLSTAHMDQTHHESYLSCCFRILVTHDEMNGHTTKTYPIDIGSASDKSSAQYIWNESNENTANSNSVDIPLIVIYWGCFSADAKIKAVSGIKRADEIKIGDQIEVFSGEILTVENIYTGEDEMIFCIVTESGMVTKVSGGHAMKLYTSDNPDGKKIAAAKIKPGDVLMTPDGNVTVKHCDEVPYGNTVYNFTFAERKTPQYIAADGFWSGDFFAQNEG
jgi:hypothetical protein